MAFDSSGLLENLKLIQQTGEGYGPEYKEVIEQAIAVLNELVTGQGSADHYFLLGEILLHLQDTNLALEAFKAGYEDDNKHLNCGLYYALLLEQAGRLNEALGIYLSVHAIAPENELLAERILTVAYADGDFKLVLEICHHYLSNNLEYAVTFDYLSRVYEDFDQYDNAIKHLDNALALDPDNEDYTQRLIILCYKDRQYQTVLSYAEYINSHDVSQAAKNIHIILARSYAEVGDLRAARSHYVKRLRDEKVLSRLDMINEIGLFHQNYEGNLDRAVFLFNYILRRDPTHIVALSNLALHSDKQFTLEAYRTAYEQQPDSDMVNYNYAFALLDDGQLEEGFKRYERRISLYQKYLSKRVSLPEDLTDKKIFVWKEQGLGDEIIWAWFYQYLGKLCAEVTVQVDKRLIPLMSRSYPEIRFVGEDNDTLVQVADFSGYDHEIMLASQGMFFADEIRQAQQAREANQIRAPFLKPDPERVAYWQQKLADHSARQAVGICWRSGLQAQLRHLNSMHVEQIADLFRDIDCDVVNLQYSVTDEELAVLRDVLGDRFIHFDELNLKDDQDDIAALCAATGQIFTGFTAVHELAGAVGAQVLCFIHFGANQHHYLYGKPFNFAYPTLEFVGQQETFLEDSQEYFKTMILERFELDLID